MLTGDPSESTSLSLGEIRRAIAQSSVLTVRQKLSYLGAWSVHARGASRNAARVEDYWQASDFAVRVSALRACVNAVDPELISDLSATLIPCEESSYSASFEDALRSEFGGPVGSAINRLALEWNAKVNLPWPMLMHQAVDSTSRYLAVDSLSRADRGEARLAAALAVAIPMVVRSEFAEIGVRGRYVLLWRGLGKFGVSPRRKLWPELAGRRVPHDYSAQPLSSFTANFEVALDFARDGEGILLAELVPLSAVFSTSLVLGFLGFEVVVRDHRHRWLVPLRRTEGAWVVDYSAP
ncbi:hypothetical protein ACKAMS_30065 [Rhodococcus sp. 5A-K4]|uniref:hypothetical protein n=1 Tax=Rhodococcus TaxID=1827 RepID=UPI000E4708DC|nr:hypothetical protein [Rhodococcus sp. WY5]RGP48666.1 hypothetical protein AWH04_26275 [Rhodococcus erythropolis]